MRINIIVTVMIFLALICLCGCSSDLQTSGEQTSGEVPYNTIPIPDPAEINRTIYSVNIDWVNYSTTEEVVDAATNIFTGKVVDVSFEVVDTSRDEIIRSEVTDSLSCRLYTVYTIEVDKNYKGNHAETVKLFIVGGIIGQYEEEQFGRMEEVGLDGWTLVTKTKYLTLGESYLFCTQRATNWDMIIGMDDFVYYPNSQLARQIIQQCEKR